MHKSSCSTHNVYTYKRILATYFVVKFLSGARYGLKLGIHGYLHARKSLTICYHWEVSTFMGTGMIYSEKQIVTVYIAADKMTHASHFAVLA